MAGSSLLALIDDIASVLDDVALMTKMAAKKTSGVLGDDLALNAQQVTGVRAEREIPVVWAVAKGSLVNKAILVPLALLISAFIPWAVMPLMMAGGAFLCYEGCEKLAHKFLHAGHETTQQDEPVIATEDIAQFEKTKIRGAIRTDFILSAEIITITLGVVANLGFLQQVLVLAGIALIMTAGVYGLVAGIVKLDDLGFYLSQRKVSWLRALGHRLVLATPYLMKSLSVIGTAAMFMVGGGILTHGIAIMHHIIVQLTVQAGLIPVVGAVLQAITPTILNMLFGVVAGVVVLGVVAGIRALKPARPT